MHSRTPLLLASLCCCLCLFTTDTSQAQQRVKLHATLNPNRLGQATTVGFSFQITTPPHETPSPLTEVNIDYPGNLGIALSELGLKTCSSLTLEIIGPPGCPSNSIMGYGTATAEIPIGTGINKESANITIVRSPTQNGHFAMLFYAEAGSPIKAELVFPGLLLPTTRPYGGRVNIGIPLIPTVPDGPDVAVTRLTATLGPEHLTYYTHRHGHTVPYNPKGILLPDTCPRGGFPFATTITFQNQAHAHTRTTVPCPHST